jgi:hypothetical protein
MTTSSPQRSLSQSTGEAGALLVGWVAACSCEGLRGLLEGCCGCSTRRQGMQALGNSAEPSLQPARLLLSGKCLAAHGQLHSYSSAHFVTALQPDILDSLYKRRLGQQQQRCRLERNTGSWSCCCWSGTAAAVAAGCCKAYWSGSSSACWAVGRRPQLVKRSFQQKQQCQQL